jgi:hypothetical protein
VSNVFTYPFLFASCISSLKSKCTFSKIICYCPGPKNFCSVGDPPGPRSPTASIRQTIVRCVPFCLFVATWPRQWSALCACHVGGSGALIKRIAQVALQIDLSVVIALPCYKCKQSMDVIYAVHHDRSIDVPSNHAWKKSKSPTDHK